MSEWPVVVPVLSLLVGMLSGAWLWYVWHSRRKNGHKPEFPLPGLWPLRGRTLVSSHEQEVWQLLKSVFHDHAVMVKVPIVRFTQLRETPMTKSASQNGKRLNSEQWLEMLGGLYTTFTVCTLNGKVVGCVDVPGMHDGSKASRALKEALLVECGMAYLETSAFNVPDASTLRELFLGEMANPPADHQATRGGDSDFHADMAAFARQQPKPAR